MIKAERLYEDIVFDNQHFNPNLVVEEYLPELLKNNSGGLPMYKYLKEYHGEVFERVKNNVLKYTEVDKFLKDHTPKCLYGNSDLKRLIRIYDLLKYK